MQKQYKVELKRNQNGYFTLLIHLGMTWTCPSLISVKWLDQRVQHIDPLRVGY